MILVLCCKDRLVYIWIPILVVLASGYSVRSILLDNFWIGVCLA